MGKIRVNTIGDESLENRQKKEAEKRREAKKVAKIEEPPLRPVPESVQGFAGQASLHQGFAGQAKEIKEENIGENHQKIRENQKKKKAKTKKVRSPRYLTSKKVVERNKLYNISEALELLSRMQKAKFDETVELHINTIDMGISGNVTLPHGTGKQTKVAIISPAKDANAAEELLKKIEAGKIDFDVLIATPDAMPRLAKVARILGPRGLMPNPKNGTISPNPEVLAKKYEGGQMNYKTEAKSPIIHITVGKMSFGKNKLQENISVFLGSIEKAKMKNAYIKSTMSPSLRLLV